MKIIFCIQSLLTYKVLKSMIVINAQSNLLISYKSSSWGEARAFTRRKIVSPWSADALW